VSASAVSKPVALVSFFREDILLGIQIFWIALGSKWDVQNFNILSAKTEVWRGSFFDATKGKNRP